MATDLTTETRIDLQVVGKEVIAEGVTLLTLRHPSGAELPGWEPGAHIDLLLADGLVRQYSLCGDPTDRSRFQVAVLREPSSRGGSAFVHDVLGEGDSIGVGGPRNHFALRPARRYLFIAGGIGITPLLPMIAQVATSGAGWRLLYGGRSRVSMAFREQLVRQYADAVQVHPADEVGPLDLEPIGTEPTVTAEDLAVYCCGPEPLLEAVEASCADLPPGTLHTERFTARPGAADTVDREFDVVLAQSGGTHTVPVGRSILEVVEEAGVQVMVSCTEGVCGTCETRVLDGVPDHRDSVLTDDEREVGASIIVCVSRSCSARLVLDL